MWDENKCQQGEHADTPYAQVLLLIAKVKAKGCRIYYYQL